MQCMCSCFHAALRYDGVNIEIGVRACVSVCVHVLLPLALFPVTNGSR